ncbi:hypothetical protein MBM_02077 [Drepanopeziza brunnea f. sp. 'multigermtubi' MB_m1]|uniref:Flavin-containing monooxygenase n=1 Tax=Marssonina brunnea f. sp. multigermtubi (strain MB_m1) TaxID=1072389 RepID=K1WR76_MARBU|nr:uncharacterized protein MBM_02077 [Drepanopeziza brunnea f. sp. 'multigermtubi' MB_m1]EKD20125.1 hypothetical protein MBM_02077 [Drepanopeziza brunnea f. sp. 'multigermtubi' MB_m1]
MGSLPVQQPAAVTVPSSERCEPGSFPLKIASYPSNSSPKDIDPTEVAATWVSNFNASLAKPSLAILSHLFLEESYWRDQLCLSWDFHTLNGPASIVALLTASRMKSLSVDTSSDFRSPKVTALDDGNGQTVQVFLKVETDVGYGEGLVRLAEEAGVWKVFTLLTFLKELKGHPETVGKQRPVGVKHGERVTHENWADRRLKEEMFKDDDPVVLIKEGAGQSGLTAAARLKMIGIKSLIIDREERIGDNWRSRYHHLVLHDSVWFDHLPYLPFPESWPIFTPKDKLGDWFESYVKLLDLNAWTQTTISKSSWDKDLGKWTVTLDRTVNGKIESRVMFPKHIIQATGASGLPNIPSLLTTGQKIFKGSRICHSSTYPGSQPAHGQSKKAVIIGCCNSAHDIAQDYHANGYAVTMIQRSSTLVLNVDTNVRYMAALYGEEAPRTEDADVLFMSSANQVVKKSSISMTAKQAVDDAETLAGLEKAGFKLDQGPGGSGLWMKYLQRGGGYYLDVGCSQLIIDGKIKIKQGVEIAEVLPDGLKFADGEVLEADEVVFATGYLNMRSQCRAIFGDELADKVKDVWGFDEEGEIRTMWRGSGHRNFWFMGGNLALCRWYSRLLALQIKGIEEGLVKWEDM